MSNEGKKWQFAFVLLGIAAVFLVATPALTEAAEDADCKVEILTPKTGARVGASGLVTGTANVKENYLWVFAGRRGIALTWPQGSGAAAVRDGEWEVLVHFGGPQDRGAQFRVSAAVVDAKVNRDLDAWVQRSDASGDYRGIRFPLIAEGCGKPAEITVVKD
jgi:hypothetical protein